MIDKCSKVILVETFGENKKGKLKIKVLVDDIYRLNDRCGGCSICKLYKDEEENNCRLNYVCLHLIELMNKRELNVLVCPIELLKDEDLKEKYKEYEITETIKI